MQSKFLKSSTLWSQYSMIRSTLLINDDIDVFKYLKLIAFLKCTNDGYVPNKSCTFIMENVTKFLNEAPDEKYLLFKVVLVFGLNGACRKCELFNITMNDITDTGTVAVITLHNTKTKTKRVFTITDDCDAYNLFKEYLALRPSDVKHDKFFLVYRNGKCTRQCLGFNTLSNIPKDIAHFLHLPNHHKYTSHCIRHTSTTFLADSGVDILTLKRHGGWRSTTTAEGYINNSIMNKIRTSKQIFKYVSGNKEMTTAKETDNKQLATTNEKNLHHCNFLCNEKNNEVIQPTANEIEVEKKPKPNENLNQCNFLCNEQNNEDIRSTDNEIEVQDKPKPFIVNSDNQQSIDIIRRNNITCNMAKNDIENKQIDCFNKTNNIETSATINFSNISNCVFNIYNNNTKKQTYIFSFKMLNFCILIHI